MNTRLLLLAIVVFGSGCHELPFFSQRSDSPGDGEAGSSGAAAAPGDNTGGAASGGDNGGAANGGFGTVDSFPGFGGVDASVSSSNVADGVALAAADSSDFSVLAPWAADGGITSDGGLGFSFPDPSSLPPASTSSQTLALAGDSTTMDVGDLGCGEPPSCYLRTIIATAHGHVYAARLSTSYPKDTCVTKVINCDNDVLVGDSNGRFGDATCVGTTPQITLGFLVPQSLLFSWNSGQMWLSTNGFKSEWTLDAAGDDSGSYEPIPGFTSKLWPLWSRFFAGAELYGEMLVPLRHSTTHELAIGFALFDVRVRQ